MQNTTTSQPRIAGMTRYEIIRTGAVCTCRQTDGVMVREIWELGRGNTAMTETHHTKAANGA